MLLVIVRALGAREESLLEDTGVAALVERGDAQLLVRVLLDDAQGIVMSVEGRHEEERDIDAVAGVEVLNLAHSEVEEGHVVLDLESTLGTSHT